MSDDSRRLGILNFWKSEKGYGFIRSAIEDFEGRIVRINNHHVVDTFLHVSQVERAGIKDIREGDILLFDVTTDPRTMKPRASNIERVGHADAESEKKAAA